MKKKFFIFVITLLSVFALTSCSNDTSSSNFQNTKTQTKSSLPSKAERDLAVKKVQQDRQEWIAKYGSDIETIKDYALSYNRQLNPSKSELILALENNFFNYNAIIKALDELNINYSENARKRVVSLTNYRPSITPRELQDILLDAGFTVDEIINMNNSTKAEVEKPKLRNLTILGDKEIKRKIINEFNEFFDIIGFEAKIYDSDGYSFLITCKSETEVHLMNKELFIKIVNEKPLDFYEKQEYYGSKVSVRSFLEEQANIHRVAFSARIENPVEKDKNMFTVKINNDGKGEVFDEYPNTSYSAE